MIGVFVGIQASNWNQGRIDRRQAREYRAMLRTDLDDNLSNLASRRRYYQWVRSEGLATLAELERPSKTLDAQFLVHAYQTSQIQPWALKRNTYDQIVSTGQLANLGGPRLRDEVANFYVNSDVSGFNIAALPPYRDILRRVMPYAVQQQIRAHCNERVTVDSRGRVHVLLPQGCRLTLDPATVREAVTQVHDWPGLALDLNRWLVDVDHKLLSVDLMSRRARALQTALSREDG